MPSASRRRGQEGRRAQYAEDDDPGDDEALGRRCSPGLKQGAALVRLEQLADRHAELVDIGLDEILLARLEEHAPDEGDGAAQGREAPVQEDGHPLVAAEPASVDLLDFVDESRPAPVDRRLEQGFLIRKIGVDRARGYAGPLSDLL